MSAKQGQGIIFDSISLDPPASLMISPPSPDLGLEEGEPSFRDNSYLTEKGPFRNPVKDVPMRTEPNSPPSPLLSLSKDGFKLPERLTEPQFARNIVRAPPPSDTPYQPLHQDEDTSGWPVVPPTPVTELAIATSFERNSVCCFPEERPFTVPERLRGSAFWGGVTACLHLLHDLMIGRPISDVVFESYYIRDPQGQEDEDHN